MSGQPEKSKRSEAQLQRRRKDARRYRVEHREQALESERRSRERVKERKRLQAKQDPEGFRERQRAYNRDRYLRDKATAGYKERVAKKSAAAKLRRQTNPVTRAKTNLAKMKAKHGVDYETAWMAFWQAQDGLCYLCGDPLRAGRATTLDHDHTCCPRRQYLQVLSARASLHALQQTHRLRGRQP
jgi:Recombination endonuclease VII